MAARATETTVTFKHPFMLAALDRPQPAGTYALETIEEELPDFSFAVFRRTATMLRLPALSSTGRSSEVFCVDPEELAAALASDRLKESQ